MSDWIRDYRHAVNITVLLITMVVVSLVLGYGYESADVIPDELTVGKPSPAVFPANRSVEVPDADKTEKARTTAELNVEAPYSKKNLESQQVFDRINLFYADLGSGAEGEPIAIPKMIVPELVGKTLGVAENEVASAKLVLVVTDFLEPPDEALDGTVAFQEPDGNAELEEGSVIGVGLYVVGASSTTTSSTTTTVPPTTTTLPLPRIDVDTQIESLLLRHPSMPRGEIARFVDLYTKDLDRVAEGSASVFDEMQSVSVGWADDELQVGIRERDLDSIRTEYLNPETRPPITIAGLSNEDLQETSEAMGTIVARNIRANITIDQTKWDLLKEAARAAVPEQTTSYSFGDTIADAGETLTAVQIAAITELKLYEPVETKGVPLNALIIFGIISILIVVFLLVRIAPENLDRPRRVALMGIILILAALASRIPGLVEGNEHATGFVIPAVAIGVMASILFDQRTALMLAIPVAGFTAVSTGDISLTVYAGIAAAIPVAFVSSVSTRSQLRLSVMGSAVVAAPVAAGLEYLFSSPHTAQSALEAGSWAFAGAIIGGFIGQGIVSFLESAFGVTTTMTLLDLLDRNHPALQVLEEKAPGTFNHSMLVGSIAGRAARSIGADPLLAQAAAWYHDLGKTEHPQYFVENQIGHNPHDELPPTESAQIIRAHVIDGLALAKQFRIPEEVSNGIRMHHGTSLMRYFYHKAITIDPDTDPEEFRHHGAKPTRKEMAIVMIADATEAAARAYAQSEQPTEEGLRKLVDAIVSEKLDDGQFSESFLTFGELTTIKAEVIAALSAYYHARVEYPDFPEAPAALPS